MSAMKPATAILEAFAFVLVLLAAMALIRWAADYTTSQ